MSSVVVKGVYVYGSRLCGCDAGSLASAKDADRSIGFFVFFGGWFCASYVQSAGAGTNVLRDAAGTGDLANHGYDVVLFFSDFRYLCGAYEIVCGLSI